MPDISTKPYLIRAIHEWCSDNGYRPYIAVAVDEHTVVPREFVRDGEIVLNVSTVATNRLSIGNERLEFEARFGGVARQVSIPIANITAIFAQENGQGMAFEVHPAQGGPGQDDVTAGAALPARVPDDGSAGGEDQAGAEAATVSATSPAAGRVQVPLATAGRTRKRPKLAAVPRDAAAPRSTRRRTPIAAVPKTAAPKSGRGDGVPEQSGSAPATATDGPDGDGPEPHSPRPRKPHLTRVK